jgi:hypothetical protein
VLELIVNKRLLDRVALAQTIRQVRSPAVQLQPGDNVVRFTISAGSARISAQDPRMAAVGVQGLQIRRLASAPHPGHLLFLPVFLLGAGGLTVIAWRVPLVAGFRGVDALGAGLLGAFGALTVSASILSVAHALTGVPGPWPCS